MPLSGRARDVRWWLEMVALVDEVGGEWWMFVVGVLMVRRRTTTPAWPWWRPEVEKEG